MSATQAMVVERNYVVERNRDGSLKDYLRLVGPFEYPEWGPLTAATPLGPGKAMQYAECLLPHPEAYRSQFTKLLAVPVQDAASRMANAKGY